MDKSWILKPRNTPEYVEGLNKFLDFAFANGSVDEKIICPCPSCKFKKWHIRDIVYDHLIIKPFPRGYTIWVRHGERIIDETIVESSSRPQVRTEYIPRNDPVQEDQMQEMIHEAFGVRNESESVDVIIESRNVPITNNTMPQDAKEFYELIRDGQQPLYEGCEKYSKLSFMVKLYHIKCLCGISDKAMSLILELLVDAFENAKIPSSFYEAKKTISKLGHNYKKIDVCPNDCMLYIGEDEKRDVCKRCNTSRWKPKKGKKKRLLPAKVLRYFPLKPRLQRLFMSSKTAEHMRWHTCENNNDNTMRHPRDSEAWKKFDTMNPAFAADARNVRLGLATDGFNPFGNLSTSYSIWPVVLMPYNLPPWMCMKSSSFLLSMIIPGRRAPGNDIDVYLQPLIEELKELWYSGVETFDSFTNEAFTMRAALMWTVSDFPGLGTISGWNTHTGLACPRCNFDSVPLRLPHSRKWCFMGHRRFLPSGHKFRLAKCRFDGRQEKRSPPLLLSGSEILRQQDDVNVVFGKDAENEEQGKRSRARDTEVHQWRKKSIFFELPYWKDNLLRHSFDVMHIEKNVCDNVLFTLLNEHGKSKDHLNARKDLKEMGIKSDLWPNDNGKYPPALFTLTNKNKDIFLKLLRNVTVPDGYSSNISRCIDLRQRKIGGLKSHDSHVLIEQLLPLAIRKTLPKQVAAVLIELCSFFKCLCERILNVNKLDELHNQVVLTLCHMEMIFPPSFFTVMVHLVVHLAEEAKIGGPVQYRWMYPIERYLKKFKSYVKNKAQPEGSIAEGYLAEEVLTFCSRYLDGIETAFNRPLRVDDEPILGSSGENTLFPPVGKPIGASQNFILSPLEKFQAHRHVLTNCKEVDPFLREFRDIVKRQLRSRTRDTAEIDKRVHKEFVEWFARRIQNDNEVSHSLDIKLLALGPINYARRYSAYNVNGFKFRTIDRDQGLKTQNSGVFATFGTRSYASSSDMNMRYGGVPYYGKLVDIIELNYHGRFMVTLFKCMWADTTKPGRGIMIDEFGFTSVNFSKLISTGDNENDEPYIEASDARMVYYVIDESDKNWSVVVHLKPRDLYEMEQDDDADVYNVESNEPQRLEMLFPDDDRNINLSRFC